jgi:hypothetical protein
MLEAVEVRADAGSCPRCDAPRTRDQRYCVDCGHVLPPARGAVAAFRRFWVRRFGWYPGDWTLPALAALVAAAAGAAGAVALSQRGEGGASTFAAAPPPLAAETPAKQKARSGAAKTTAPRGAVPNGQIAWPDRVKGWTVVLVSLPRSAGADAAAQRAASAAKTGLPEAGFLVSDRFASLHPGYFVIFTGIYASRAEAEAAVPTARSRGFGGAYARPVVP